MTDNEIIKALNDCLTANKMELFFITSENKIAGLKIVDVLDLINRQKSKILKERNKNSKLRNERNHLKAEIERLESEMANISVKTLKRFEKNIKDVQVTLGQTWEIQSAIKETLKEMVGDNNA